MGLGQSQRQELGGHFVWRVSLTKSNRVGHRPTRTNRMAANSTKAKTKTVAWLIDFFFFFSLYLLVGLQFAMQMLLIICQTQLMKQHFLFIPFSLHLFPLLWIYCFSTHTNYSPTYLILTSCQKILENYYK